MIRALAPSECSATELSLFAMMVREGFDGSDASLPDRIESARVLMFASNGSGGTIGIAALKCPTSERRQQIFEEALLGESSENLTVELGWVFVKPTHRRSGIAGQMCSSLVRMIGAESSFATTRPDNEPMKRVLSSLGYRRVGRTFTWRDKDLALFLLHADGDR